MEPLTAAAVIGGSAVLGGIIGDKSAKRAAERNAASQREFAQHGIQWKVEDARRAGISPEFALSGQTASFQPTETGGRTGDLIADAGQNIARASLASATKEDREFDALMKAETLRGMKLQNDKIDPGLTSVNRPGNPPFPSPRGNVIPGQGNSPVVDVPLERTGQLQSARHSEGASIPSVGWAETANGGLRPIPSQDIKNRIEDQMIPEGLWAAQHVIAPNFGMGSPPPKSALPKGYSHWEWDKDDQAFYPKKIGQSSRTWGDVMYEHAYPKDKPLWKIYTER